MTIKRGVSLYSYQAETFLGRMTLEDCIRTSVEMGADGIEIVGEQTFWGWPEAGVDPEAVETWRRLIKAYDATPVSHDFMLDYKRYKGRPMPFEEQVASVRRDVEFGALLGMKYIRSLVSVAPEVLVAAAPYAEEKNIEILLEVHAPLHFDHPCIIRHAEAYEASGSDALGFLPDMGMLLSRFPRVWKDRFIRNGCPQTEEGEEYSIPYDQIVSVLKSGGYSGYICSEYEGNRWVEDVQEVDSVGQVRRQQDMLKRLIGEPAPAALAA